MTLMPAQNHDRELDDGKSIAHPAEFGHSQDFARVIDTAQLHGIAGPPQRADYRTHEQFMAAYDAWWLAMLDWKHERIGL